MNGCGEREHATRRFIDESGGCCILVGHHASTRTRAYPMALTSPAGLYYAGSCRVDTEGPLVIEERQDGAYFRLRQLATFRHCNILPSLFSWPRVFRYYWPSL